MFLLLLLYIIVESYQAANKSTPASLDEKFTPASLDEKLTPASLDEKFTPFQYYGIKPGGRCPFQLQRTSTDSDPANGSSPLCTKSRYRSIDGSCNNLLRPNWGRAMTPYVRLTKNNYADGVHEMPVSVAGKPLPNVRELSFRFFPDKNIFSPMYNLNAAQWGQIITHDMSLTAGVPQISIPLKCCNFQGKLTEAGKNSSNCTPILIPPNDPTFQAAGIECFPFVRTQTTKDEGCTATNAPAQPLTAVTGFMDLSIVYGNNANQTDSLRTKTGGRMLTVVRKGQEWPPQQPDATSVCLAKSNDEPCYLAGDIRANQNTQLTLLQVILLRNHNRIANKLAHLNPHWNDETLFEEARRIHIAEIQHINYYEYLPNILGFENMRKRKLIHPGAVGYVNDYDPNVNPSIINEHATAALRFFHTLIRGFLRRISKDRELAGLVRLSDWLNKPSILEMNNTFNQLIRGLTTQKMSDSDEYFTDELTIYLFRGNRTFGNDLRAIDIQRGRDHGLGSYIAARDACKLPVPKTFRDMRNYISKKNVDLLKNLYASPQDVDLVVAGSLERRVPGALAGPTFFCILTKQFYRTRVGDRFFYENGMDPQIAFSPAQLKAIRKGANMARFLCDNAKGIHRMQRKAFELVSSVNPIIPCYELPFIDLSQWQE